MRKILQFAVPILVFVGTLAVELLAAGNTGNDSAVGAQGYHRIISLAPSVTEILFDLGLGDRVVGVTRYCRYPPGALTKASVGGYYDPAYEEIVRLKPDLVVMLSEHVAAKQLLRGLDIKVLMVDNADISGIVSSIMKIGTICGVEQNALKIVEDIEKRMGRIKHGTNGLPKPRVMISLGRGMGSGSLADIYIAGKNTFYGEMIVLAGGVNAYNGTTVTFPQVSNEGIYQLNPQIIIDMVPDLDKIKISEEKILAEWNSVANVDAVRNKRVYLFEQDYSVIPGPRFISILEQMARVIHPEIQWK
jgi:iron complex transport system substrate-binding protein